MADVEPDADDGDEDDGDLLTDIKSLHELSRSHYSDWRGDAKEDFDFVSGKQWSDEDMAILSEQMRPAIVFNRVGPVIDAVSGSEVQNRQEVRFVPREMGDVGVNELLTGATQWVREQCDAEDEESDAFYDAITCGVGWTETHLETDEEPDGKIHVSRVDVMEMYPDPKSRKRNYVDARYVQRVKRFTDDEFYAKWPDADIGDAAATWDADDDDQPAQPVVTDPPRYKNNATAPRRSKGTISVLEHQWYELETVYRVADPQTGKIVEFDAERFKTIEPQLKAINAPYVENKKRKYMRAFVAGETILEQGPGPCDGHFTYQAITAKRDRNSNTWFGLVRAMKDPQRWANKFFSQILHILNSNAKGGLLAESDAFVDQRKAEDEWARPDSITMLKPGAMGKVREKMIANMPASFTQALEYAVKSIPDVTGVNLEMMGLADRHQAGVLEYQRKQAGLTILATLFDSLRRYRKQQGRVLMYFIQEYISDGRLVRILGDGVQKFVPLLRAEGAAAYDIIVDDAPTAPHQKERVFQVLSSLLPSMEKMGILPPKEVLDYAPLPTTLIEAWKKSLAQPKPADQQAQAMGQAELKKLMADAMQAEASAKLSLARIQEIMGGQQTSASETQIEAQYANNDTARVQLDNEKATVDAALAVHEARKPGPSR